MVAVQDAFGKRLRDIRRRKDLTQEQLADLSGLSIQYVGEIERGKRNPSLTTIETLAKALTLPITDFFELQEFQIDPKDIKAKLISQIENADDETLHNFFAISRVFFG